MIEFTINHQGEIITISVDEKELDFKDGYCSVYFNIYGFYYSGVIDKNLRMVIPFVFTNNEQDFSATTIFKNHKAIYGIKNEEFYLVDLETVQFKKENNYLIPINYILKFDAYDDIDDEKVIIAKNEKYFLFDVIKEKKLSIDFNYMINRKDTLNGQLLVVPNSNAPTLLLNCTLNKEGQIQNPLHLGDISIWLNNTLLKEKNAVVEEVSKIYRKEFTNKFYFDKVLH